MPQTGVAVQSNTAAQHPGPAEAAGASAAALAGGHQASASVRGGGHLSLHWVGGGSASLSVLAARAALQQAQESTALSLKQPINQAVLALPCSAARTCRRRRPPIPSVMGAAPMRFSACSSACTREKQGRASFADNFLELQMLAMPDGSLDTCSKVALRCMQGCPAEAQAAPARRLPNMRRPAGGGVPSFPQPSGQTLGKPPPAMAMWNKVSDALPSVSPCRGIATVRILLNMCYRAPRQRYDVQPACPNMQG